MRLKFGLTQFQGFDVGYKLLCSGRLQPNGLTKFDGLILRPTLDGLLINESAENSQISKTRKAEHGRPVADDCDLIVSSTTLPERIKYLARRTLKESRASFSASLRLG